MVKDTHKKVVLVISVVYTALMVYFLFLRSGFDIGGSYWEHLSMNINVVPLNTIRQMVYLIVNVSNPHLLPYAIINLLGNVVGFIPFGVLLPCLLKQAQFMKKFLLYTIGVIIAVELIQLFSLRGSCDIDDLILNTTGALIGYALWRWRIGKGKMGTMPNLPQQDTD